MVRTPYGNRRVGCSAGTEEQALATCVVEVVQHERDVTRRIVFEVELGKGIADPDAHVQSVIVDAGTADRA